MFLPTASPFPSPFASPFAQPFATAAKQNNAPQAELPRELSLPRYINYLADYSGCGHWRILWPEQLINAMGHGCSSSLTSMVFDPRWYEGVKCVKVQRQASSSQKQFITFLKEIQRQHNFKIIYEVDDVVFREDIPDYNKFKFAFDNDEIRQNCIDIINMCDEVTVTCDFMKKLYQERTGKKEITVIPNFVPNNFWTGTEINSTQAYKVSMNGSGTGETTENKTTTFYALPIKSF
jgi:hypothetical protein